MIIGLVLLLAVGIIPGEEQLNEISERYAAAEGIQWQIRSVVYSDVFDDADTTFIDFSYSPPDTFSLIGDREKIMGIGDTLWVLSTHHRQVQKKNVEDAVMPADFILSWRYNYDLDSVIDEGSNTRFDLTGKEDIKPKNIEITANNKMKIEAISYLDTKGDRVTLTIKKEKLSRPRGYDLFFRNIPDDFDFIDLTR